MLVYILALLESSAALAIGIFFSWRYAKVNTWQLSAMSVLSFAVSLLALV